MSNWKEYDYTGQWQGDDTVYRPIIDVEISNPNNGKIFPCKALVDSGTDNIAIDSEVAEILGINLDLCRQGTLTGLGEKTAYRCEIGFAVPSLKIKEKVPVLFAQDLPYSVLLGQRWFFHLFDVRFEKHHNKFFLRKALKKP